MLKRLLVDLLSLLGLGVALVVSFAITGLASGFAAAVLEFLGLADQAWAKVAARACWVWCSASPPTG